MANKFIFCDFCKIDEIEEPMLLPVHTHRCELCFMVISNIISRGVL